MTTLLIQAASIPLAVQLPSAMQMNDEQFYAFCLANRDLRIERCATGDVIIMPPAFSEVGNRNCMLAVQLGEWTDQSGTGIGFTLAQALRFPIERFDHLMPLG
jgi:Uma2 family endonuclease